MEARFRGQFTPIFESAFRDRRSVYEVLATSARFVFGVGLLVVWTTPRRRPTKATRWMPNCHSSPKVIIPQAMYGTSQLGLRTTWRIVTLSLPGSKLAW